MDQRVSRVDMEYSTAHRLMSTGFVYLAMNTVAQTVVVVIAFAFMPISKGRPPAFEGFWAWWMVGTMAFGCGPVAFSAARRTGRCAWACRANLICPLVSLPAVLFFCTQFADMEMRHEVLEILIPVGLSCLLILSAFWGGDLGDRRRQQEHRERMRREAERADDAETMQQNEGSANAVNMPD